MTAIEWTDQTWNPVTGCSKVSPGCAHCYIVRTPPFFMAGRKFVRGSTDLQLHPERLSQALRWRAPRMVFVNSLSDVFEERVPDEFIVEMWAVMVAAGRHTFQVLTKRPERMLELAPRLPWPPNVWMGVTAESPRWARVRGDLLRQVPAAVRFLSCEPLLGPLDDVDLTGIGWVICGGESGPVRRRMRPEWARGLRDRCVSEGVPFFFKQWGGRTAKAGGRELDGRTWDEFPEVLAL